MQHLSVISSVQMDISSMQMEKKQNKTTTKKQNNNTICTEHCELRTKNGPSKNHVKVRKELYKAFYNVTQRDLTVSFLWF